MAGIEKDKRFDHLLNPIRQEAREAAFRRDLAQNWNIDVAKDLEDYLDELEHIQISFDGGKTSLNFAEAALLIQGSACIYSRKVEYLYSLIYQALDMVHAHTKQSKKGSTGIDHDAAALEEEAEEEFLLLDDVIVEGKNIDLPDRLDDMAGIVDMTMNYSGGTSATPNQKKTAAALLAKTPLSMLAASRFERRDGKDFRIMGCAVTRNGALMLDASMGALELLSVSVVSRADSAVQAATPGTQNHLRPHENEGHTPADVAQDFESAAGGVHDVMFDEDDYDPNPAYYEVSAIADSTFNTVAPVARQRNTSKSSSSALLKPSVDMWSQLDPNADTGASSHKPFKKGRTYMVLKNALLIANVGPMAAAAQAMSEAASNGGKGTREAKALLAKAEATRHKAAVARAGSLAFAGNTAGHSLAAAFSAMQVDGQASIGAPRRLIAPAMPDQLCTFSGAAAAISSCAPLFPELDVVYNRIKATATKNRLASRRAAAQSDPALAAVGYAYEDGEADEDNGIYQAPDPDTGAGAVDGFGGDDLYYDGAPDFGPSDPHAWLDDVGVVRHSSASGPSASLAAAFSSMADEGDNVDNYENLVEQHMKRIGVLQEQYINDAGMFVQESALSRRVSDWQEKLAPVLEEEDKREEFDINNYGRNILERLEVMQTQETLTHDAPVEFQEAISKPTVYEVCRSFLATLQLANFGNVEILERHEKTNVAHDDETWEFSQPVYYNAELSQATAPHQVRNRRGVNFVEASASMCSGFSLRLLQSMLPVDGNDAAMYTVRTAENVSSISEATHDANAMGAGKKRANSGKIKSKPKRIAAEDHKLAAKIPEELSDHDAAPTASVLSPPRHQSRKPRPGESEGATGETLPPSPYKPGELHSPEHKRARVANEVPEGVAPLSSLPANAVTGRVARKPPVTASDAENLVSAGGKRMRAARSAAVAAKELA